MDGIPGRRTWAPRDAVVLGVGVRAPDRGDHGALFLPPHDPRLDTALWRVGRCGGHPTPDRGVGPRVGPRGHASGDRSPKSSGLVQPFSIRYCPSTSWHADATGFMAQSVHAPVGKVLATNFYEKALFVKADLLASSRTSAAAGPFALCFYSHSRGAHILLVARCIG